MRKTWRMFAAAWALALAVSCGLATTAGAQGDDPPTARDTTQIVNPPETPTVTTRTTETERVTERMTETSVTPGLRKIRRVALFVKNRAGAEMDDKVDAFSELISGAITDQGFSVISRDDVINSVSSFAGEGANAGDKNLPGADVDAIMSNNTTALRLADMLEADYVMVVSISTFGASKRTVDAYGVKRQVITGKLRATGKILDRFVGGTLGAVNVTAETKATISENVTEEVDWENDLIADAADKIAAEFGKRAAQGRINEAAGNDTNVNLTVACTIQDMTLPEIRRDGDGQYVVSEINRAISAVDVAVEVNGAVVGTAPGTFRVRAGLNKVRLIRDGCRPWEQTVRITDGQQLFIALRMTDEAIARWRQDTAFLHDLRNGEKLSDAQVKVAEGLAEALKQSGLVVEMRADGSVWVTK